MKTPGAGHELQLWRLWHYLSGFVHYYRMQDESGMELAVRKMNDQMSAMMMSCRIAELEAVRQALLDEERMEADYNRLKEGGNIPSSGGPS